MNPCLPAVDHYSSAVSDESSTAAVSDPESSSEPLHAEIIPHAIIEIIYFIFSLSIEDEAPVIPCLPADFFITLLYFRYFPSCP